MSHTLGNFAHQVHKKSLEDEEFSALLIPTYLLKTTIPSWYNQGLFILAFLNSFMGGLPTYSGPDVAHLPLNVDGAGPASATILTSCHMGEDPGGLPTISNPQLPLSFYSLFNVMVAFITSVSQAG